MERPQFSEILFEQRRRLGYSTVQAAQVLRLREDVLIAFEEGDFERMPKSGYAQGMLASYARYLGLDAAELVSLYVREYEDYRRGRRRSVRREQPERSGPRTQWGTYDDTRDGRQPYVAPRGLLPTSGGPAGDLGTFATTRVRTRSGELPRDGVEDTGSWDYPKSRPYTGRTPRRSSRDSRNRRSRRPGDIRTMRLEDQEFTDDIYLDRQVSPYKSASTSNGRRSRSTSARVERPQVRRRSSNDRVRRQGDQRRPRNGRTPQRRNSRNATMLDNGIMPLAIAGVAIIVLALILIISVSSCVSRNASDRRSVPVSTATAADAESQESDATSTSDGEEPGFEPIDEATIDGGNADDEDHDEGETSVSVSIADGAVTWLEVTCDGISDVSGTLTGPWQRTYTVEESLLIQAGETTAVTVVQNGNQVQFDSTTSGIATLRIQGTKPQKDDDDADDEDSSSGAVDDDASNETTTAKLGNSMSTDEGTDGV